MNMNISTYEHELESVAQIQTSPSKLSAPLKDACLVTDRRLSLSTVDSDGVFECRKTDYLNKFEKTTETEFDQYPCLI